MGSPRSLRPILTFLGLLSVLLCGLLAAAAFAPPPPKPASPTPRACTRRAPCLALVIDDIGRDPAALDRLLALPLELSFAVLPHAEHTADAVRRIHAAGRDLMLHLPLLPHDTSTITDEPIVLEPGSPVAAVLDDALARVPGAVGVNNHMGSAFSEDAAAAARLLAGVARRGLWLLDSKTTAGSRLCETAGRLRAHCITRDLFLDDPPQPVTIARRLKDATALAQQQGHAIAIGHPLSPTIRALKDFSSDAGRVRLVRLSQLASLLRP